MLDDSCRVTMCGTGKTRPFQFRLRTLLLLMVVPSVLTSLAAVGLRRLLPVLSCGLGLFLLVIFAAVMHVSKDPARRARSRLSMAVRAGLSLPCVVLVLNAFDERGHLLASVVAISVGLLVVAMRLHDLNLLAGYSCSVIVSVVMCVYPWLDLNHDPESIPGEALSVILGALAGCVFVCAIRHISEPHRLQGCDSAVLVCPSCGRSNSVHAIICPRCENRLTNGT